MKLQQRKPCARSLCRQVTEMDILNVVAYPIIRQLEDGLLFGRGEITFVIQAGIYVTKRTYMYGFLFLLIWGKAMP